MQLLDNEVIRIVTAAQPKAMARSSITTRPSSQIDNSPGRSHFVHNDVCDALTQPPPGFNPSYGSLPTDLMHLSTGIPDVAWSPALADEIGWDWGDFSQLFTEAPI